MRFATISLAGLFVFSVASAIAADKADVPKKALEEMGYRVGTWESKLLTNGVEESKPGHETTRWCSGKRSIRITSTFTENGVEIQTSGLVGWNAEEKQLIEHWYDSDGGYATFCYSLDTKKDAWVGTFKWVQANGKVLSGDSIVEKKSQDLWECNMSCMDDGKKLTWQSFNKRVKGKAK